MSQEFMLFDPSLAPARIDHEMGVVMIKVAIGMGTYTKFRV